MPIQVIFLPKLAGPRTGQLNISGNLLGGSLTVTLAGLGISTGTIALSSGSIDFGSVEVGNRSDSESITVINSGGTAVPVTSITATPPFVLTTNSCGTTSLAANSDCVLMLQFVPAAQRLRHRNADPDRWHRNPVRSTYRNRHLAAYGHSVANVLEFSGNHHRSGLCAAMGHHHQQRHESAHVSQPNGDGSIPAFEQVWLTAGGPIEMLDRRAVSAFSTGGTDGYFDDLQKHPWRRRTSRSPEPDCCTPELSVSPTSLSHFRRSR